MSTFQPPRREFLQILSGTAGAAWLAANWPALLSAAEHARQAAKSADGKLEFFTPEQARELDALTSRLIPTDDTPGAHEAGVVYFIDRALKTFASEAAPSYQAGLVEIQKRTREIVPGVSRFSDASVEQQDKILTELFAAAEKHEENRRLNPDPMPSNFLETLRVHTIFGFLVDPEGGGNLDYAGWKAIGRDPAHMFSPPFGYYDKDYPGWKPASAETEKS
jgi:gluconate 2-dehydrogenase gamma chain